MQIILNFLYNLNTTFIFFSIVTIIFIIFLFFLFFRWKFSFLDVIFLSIFFSILLFFCFFFKISLEIKIVIFIIFFIYLFSRWWIIYFIPKKNFKNYAKTEKLLLEKWKIIDELIVSYENLVFEKTDLDTKEREKQIRNLSFFFYFHMYEALVTSRSLSRFMDKNMLKKLKNLGPLDSEYVLITLLIKRNNDKLNKNFYNVLYLLEIAETKLIESESLYFQKTYGLLYKKMIKDREFYYFNHFLENKKLEYLKNLAELENIKSLFSDLILFVEFKNYTFLNSSLILMYKDFNTVKIIYNKLEINFQKNKIYKHNCKFLSKIFYILIDCKKKIWIILIILFKLNVPSWDLKIPIIKNRSKFSFSKYLFSFELLFFFLSFEKYFFKKKKIPFICKKFIKLYSNKHANKIIKYYLIVNKKKCFYFLKNKKSNLKYKRYILNYRRKIDPILYPFFYNKKMHLFVKKNSKFFGELFDKKLKVNFLLLNDFVKFIDSLNSKEKNILVFCSKFKTVKKKNKMDLKSFNFFLVDLCRLLLKLQWFFIKKINLILTNIDKQLLKNFSLFEKNKLKLKEYHLILNRDKTKIVECNQLFSIETKQIDLSLDKAYLEKYMLIDDANLAEEKDLQKFMNRFLILDEASQILKEVQPKLTNDRDLLNNLKSINILNKEIQELYNLEELRQQIKKKGILLKKK